MGSIPVTALGLSPHLQWLSPSFYFCHPISFSNALTYFHTIMADKSSRLGVRRKEKTAETKAKEEKDKEKAKEKAVKSSDKPGKKQENTPEQQKTDEKKTNGESEGATGAAANNSEDNGEFQPIELPPFEIVTGWVRFNRDTKNAACPDWIFLSRLYFD